MSFGFLVSIFRGESDKGFSTAHDDASWLKTDILDTHIHTKKSRNTAREDKHRRENILPPVPFIGRRPERRTIFLCLCLHSMRLDRWHMLAHTVDKAIAVHCTLSQKQHPLWHLKVHARRVHTQLIRAWLKSTFKCKFYVTTLTAGTQKDHVTAFKLPRLTVCWCVRDVQAQLSNPSSHLANPQQPHSTAKMTSWAKTPLVDPRKIRAVVEGQREG